MSRPVSQLPIRRGMAFAGAGIALLAGITGLTSQLLFYTPHEPAVYFFGPASYLVPTAVAIATLLRINRLMIADLLQGMWWLRIRIRVARGASVLTIFRRDTDGFVRARLNHGGCYWRVTKEKNASIAGYGCR